MAMMNGGVLSASAKKHTLTATATTHDELIEFSIAANRAVGFRNVMSEMGLEQGKATTIYCRHASSKFEHFLGKGLVPRLCGGTIIRFLLQELELRDSDSRFGDGSSSQAVTRFEGSTLND